jgi:flagellar protein FlgJ
MEVKHLSGFALTTPQGDRAALRKAAEGFEELLLTQFLKAARSAPLAEDITGGAGVDQFRDMFDSEIARSSAGRTGFGIADAVERQFGSYVKDR